MTTVKFVTKRIDCEELRESDVVKSVVVTRTHREAVIRALQLTKYTKDFGACSYFSSSSHSVKYQCTSNRDGDLFTFHILSRMDQDERNGRTRAMMTFLDQQKVQNLKLNVMRARDNTEWFMLDKPEEEQNTVATEQLVTTEVVPTGTRGKETPATTTVVPTVTSTTENPVKIAVITEETRELTRKLIEAEMKLDIYKAKMKKVIAKSDRKKSAKATQNELNRNVSSSSNTAPGSVSSKKYESVKSVEEVTEDGHEKNLPPIIKSGEKLTGTDTFSDDSISSLEKM